MHITISLFVATKLIIYQRLVLSFYKLTILYLAIPTEVIAEHTFHLKTVKPTCQTWHVR